MTSLSCSILTAALSLTLAAPALASPMGHVLPVMSQEPAPVAQPVGPQPVAQPYAQPQPVAQPYAQPQPVAQPQPYYAPPQPYAPQPAPAPQQTSRRKGLMIGGWTLFAGSYLITALIGAGVSDSKGWACPVEERCNRVGTYMLIPIVGPFLAIGPSESAVGSFFLGFAGVAQTAGLIMGIAGTAQYAADGRRNQMTALNADGLRLSRRLRLNATPTSRYDGGMLGLNYRF